jgi:hypothetical protein
LELGVFDAPKGRASIDSVVSGFKFVAKSEVSEYIYQEYLERDKGRRMPAGGVPSPFAAYWVPPSHVQALAASIISDPVAHESMWLFGINCFPTQKFTRPLLRVPDSRHSFLLWVFRVPASRGASPVRDLVHENRVLYERVRAAGGASYLALRSFEMSPADWQAHFGRDLWRALQKSKARFDPKGVLTPGQHLFRV